MADSVSTEAWLDQRRWAALEEALKAQGSNVKRHLQDYLITLYNETDPLPEKSGLPILRTLNFHSTQRFKMNPFL